MKLKLILFIVLIVLVIIIKGQSSTNNNNNNNNNNNKDELDNINNNNNNNNDNSNNNNNDNINNNNNVKETITLEQISPETIELFLKLIESEYDNKKNNKDQQTLEKQQSNDKQQKNNNNNNNQNDERYKQFQEIYSPPKQQQQQKQQDKSTASTTSTTSTPTKSTTSTTSTNKINPNIMNQQFLNNIKQKSKNKIYFSKDDYLFGDNIDYGLGGNSNDDDEDNQNRIIPDYSLPGRDLLLEGQKLRGFYLYNKATSASHRYSNSIMSYNFDQSEGRDIFEYIDKSSNLPFNPTKAYKLFEESAERGNHRAMYYLGLMNEIGEHNNIINFELAEKWYLKSANLGNSDSQRALGFLYSTGKLGYIDEAKATLYYIFSAQSGNIVAQLIMAYRYLYGHGVEKNCLKSSILYQKVAEKVISDYENRGFGYQIHSQRLSEDYEKKSDGYSSSEESDILEFFKYSAEMGDVSSLITMAKLSLEGTLMNQDFRLAINYFNQAIQEDEYGVALAEGYSGLGFMYNKGYGVEQNNNTAVQYYTKAMNSGDREARYRLAELYLYGYGVEQNTNNALELLAGVITEVTVQDEDGEEVKLPPISEALTLLGKIYAYGLGGLPIDRVKASQYLSQAVASSNDIQAYYHFSKIHLENDESSCPIVVQYLKKVSEKGPWAMLISSAQDLYDENDTNRALLLNEKAAEMGIEIAQYNAAWLYDKRYGLSQYYKSDEEIERLEEEESHLEDDQKTTIFINDLFNDNFWTQQAFRLFFYSSEQHNAISHIKIGDYFYYGIGVEKNLESAANSYQIAGNLNHPQALYNLGYLYQFGQGVPQDLFLAKRYYDLSLSIKPEQNKQGYDGYYGYIPVYLSLIGLLFHFIYLYILSIFNSNIKLSSSLSNNHIVSTTNNNNNNNDQKIIQDIQDIKSKKNIIDNLDYILDDELIQSIESYIIIFFVIVIGYLVIRRQRLILNQRQLRQHQQQQQNNNNN